MPVRSGRCSPFERMSRIRLRYWYSSCGGIVVGFGDLVVVWEGFVGSVGGVLGISVAEGGIFVVEV